MAKAPVGPVYPKCLSIIVCEGVVEDVQSHNKCILNTFNIIYAPQYPVRHDRLTIFCQLTNGHGAVNLEVLLLEDGKYKPIFQLKGQIQFISPLDVVDLVFNLRLVPIPAAGHYAIQVRTAGELIAERRIQAVLVQPPPAGPVPGGSVALSPTQE